MSKMTVKNSALYVNITPKAREFLEKCDRQTQKKYEGAESIDIDEIKDLIDAHNAKHEDKSGGSKKSKQKFKPVMMHEVLEGCQATHRVEAPRPQMSELEEMRALGAERRYQQSIKGCKPIQRSHEQAMSDVSLASKTSAFAGHFVVSFAGAFALGYYLVENFYDPENFELKIICGGVVSFFTLIIEAILFILYEEKERMRKDMAKKYKSMQNDASLPKRETLLEAPQKSIQAKKED